MALKNRIIMWGIIIFAVLLMLLSAGNAAVSDWEIDWPTSNAKEHTLRVVYKGCETLFKILDKDLKDFTDDNKSLDEVIKLAKRHYETGCKK